MIKTDYPLLEGAGILVDSGPALVFEELPLSFPILGRIDTLDFNDGERPNNFEAPGPYSARGRRILPHRVASRARSRGYETHWLALDTEYPPGKLP